VTGTIVPAQVITATGQGIDAGEFDEVVRAIRAGRVYANVHSATFGSGESAANSEAATAVIRTAIDNPLLRKKGRLSAPFFSC